MIPTRKSYNPQSISDIKEILAEAGAIDIVDTEDTYSGITFKLGYVPLHLYQRQSAFSNGIVLYVGPSDDQMICNVASSTATSQYVDFSRIVVIKGSSATDIIFISNSATHWDLHVLLDKIQNRVYCAYTAYGYNSNSRYVACFKYENETFSWNKYVVGTASGNFPGQTYSINLTEKAKLYKFTWLNEQLESAPMIYLPSILTNAPASSGIVEIDSKYYISFYSGTYSGRPITAVVCLLGE